MIDDKFLLRGALVLASAFALAACPGPQTDPDPEPSGDDDAVAAMAPMSEGGASHKRVCECTCGTGGNTTTETYDVPAGGCGGLDGGICEKTAGTEKKLSGCFETSAPKSVNAAIDGADLDQMKLKNTD